MDLALKDIRRHLGKFLATIAGVAMLLAIVLVMNGIYRGNIEDGVWLIDNMGTDLWVVERGRGGPFNEPSRMPADSYKSVAATPGVVRASPIMLYTAQRDIGGRSQQFTVIGYDVFGGDGGPGRLVDGRTLTAPRYEMVADRKTGLSPGETIRLGRDRFTVVGLVEGAMNSGGDPAVYVTLADAMALQTELDPAAQRVQAARGAVSVKSASVAAVIARMAPGADVDLLTATVRQWKHLAAMTQGEQEELLLASVVDKARRQIGLFLGILLSVSAVVIALIIYTMTMEKLKQIATLKLIGAPDRTIIALIVQQALILGASGWAIGLMLILTVKDYFPRRVVLEPFNVMVLAGIIFAVCIAASGLGVRAAMKVDPATALGS